MRHLRLRLLVLLPLLVGLALQSGCSVRKLAYRFADRFVMKAVDDSFGLTSPQSKALRQRVQQVLLWHRRSELVRYVAVLTRLERDVADGTTREELVALQADMNGAAERLAQRAAPEAGWLLASLSPAQVEAAAVRTVKEERERFKDLDQPGEIYVQRRMQAARKSLKTWLGEPTDAQLLMVAAYLRENRPHEERRREQARKNRRGLITALRARPGEPALTELARGWMTRQEVGESRTDRDAEQESRGRFLELLLRLDQSLTPTQRQHLVNELRGWRRDLAEIANG